MLEWRVLPDGRFAWCDMSFRGFESKPVAPPESKPVAPPLVPADVWLRLRHARAWGSTGPCLSAHEPGVVWCSDCQEVRPDGTD